MSVSRRDVLAGAIAAALAPQIVIPELYGRHNLNGDVRYVDPVARGNAYATALARSMAQTRWEAAARVLLRLERDPYAMVIRCVPGQD